jgi:molybdate transport system substrate-binding protein
MTQKRSAATITHLMLSLLLLLVAAEIAPAATIKILAGSAIEPAMVELLPKFEQSSGHRVAFDFNGTIGGMTDRIQNGEAADVVIVSGPHIDMLEKRGRVVSGTRIDVAKVGVGVFVRKGAPKPDISSVEAFRRAMLAARSIGWNDPAAGAPVSLYMVSLFERLGIAGDMRPKTVVFKQRSERFEAIARGDVEIGFNQISEILAAAGIDLVGPLPDPIQNYTLLAGGIVATGREPEAARALLRFIASPDARAVWTAKGFEAP